jgi:uncharacterized protein YgfB (UPF0149 family)
MNEPPPIKIEMLTPEEQAAHDRLNAKANTIGERVNRFLNGIAASSASVDKATGERRLPEEDSRALLLGGIQGVAVLAARMIMPPGEEERVLESLVEHLRESYRATLRFDQSGTTSVS